MKAEELRIGNWFIDHYAEPETTIYWQVEGIERASNSPNQKHLGVRFRNGSSWASLDILTPIPLTEEWLLKFGFKQTNGAFFELNGIGFIAGFSITDEFVLSGTFGPRHIHIYYVHQLQNLYFALTGEELKIKE